MITRRLDGSRRRAIKRRIVDWRGGQLVAQLRAECPLSRPLPPGPLCGDAIRWLDALESRSRAEERLRSGPRHPHSVSKVAPWSGSRPAGWRRRDLHLSASAKSAPGRRPWREPIRSRTLAGCLRTSTPQSPFPSQLSSRAVVRRSRTLRWRARSRSAALASTEPSRVHSREGARAQIPQVHLLLGSSFKSDDSPSLAARGQRPQSVTRCTGSGVTRCTGSTAGRRHRKNGGRVFRPVDLRNYTKNTGSVQG